MFNEILGKVNEFMYTYVLIFLLVGAGVYFTVRTGFVQLRRIADVPAILKEKVQGENGQKRVSSFQALMISTASRVGTGNIAGVSAALCLGGVGAVFWMWVIALLGGASAFV